MHFGKNHKVDPETLDTEEARAFIFFLNTEIIRHGWEIERLQKTINARRCLEGKFNKTYLDLLDSAVTRHQEDIEDAEKLIQKVRERFNL